MNIHNVLKYGPIVYSNEDLNIIVTWKSATFNVWEGDKHGGWDNIDCFTRYNVEQFNRAVSVAHSWMQALVEERNSLSY